ncbi:unnamed protein product [Rotaria magnacalcarata]|uniref:Uncharacterized protein n=1 Tax=Rotaria magnacalcarata TaxID=392030 RepID=A0A816ZA32_9BILA|nr:unnamed protein product [Rotaria magnacalcarata]CAF2270069.1 unnamed protein product [Rotaria magnacalcarata]CAF3911289.1 unnamed protein product [Rotaria magnacalcarata]CAF4100051.1 unnamed protein product [Rotaria magnacalcarata]
MNFSSLTSDTIFMLLLSLQRISRNLSHILHTLDADLNSFRQLLTEFASSILESSSIIEEKEEINDYILEKNEDFYEELFDEILEPKPRHVTTV